MKTKNEIAFINLKNFDNWADIFRPYIWYSAYSVSVKLYEKILLVNLLRNLKLQYFRDYLARVIVHMLNKHGKKAAEDDPAAQQVHQYTSIVANQYTSTPVHQHTRTPVHQYTSTPVHQYTSTPEHHLIFLSSLLMNAPLPLCLEQRRREGFVPYSRGWTSCSAVRLYTFSNFIFCHWVPLHFRTRRPRVSVYLNLNLVLYSSILSRNE